MAHQYYFIRSALVAIEVTPTIHSPVNRVLAASGRTNTVTADGSVDTGNIAAGVAVQWVQFVTETVTGGGGSWPGVATWPSGNYSIYYNVTAAGGALTYGALTLGGQVGHFARINNSGTTDVSTQEAASGLTGTGVKSHTISWTPGGSTASDRLEVVLACSRAAGGHGNESASLAADSDTADTTNGGVIVTPHSDTPATLSGTIQRVGTPTVGEITNGNATGSYPTGVQADDLILAYVVHGDGTNPTITPPSGFTSVQVVQDGNSKTELFRYWYVGSGDPTLTFTSSVANDMAVYVVAYRNVDQTSPLYGLTPATTSDPGTELSLTKAGGTAAGVALLFQGIDPGTWSGAPLPIVSPTGGTTPKPVTFPGTSTLNLALRTDDASNNPALIIQQQELEIAAGALTFYMVTEATAFANLHTIMVAIQESAGGTVSLDGKGAASSSGTGSMAVKRALSGSGAASSSGTGDMTKFVHLAGTGDTAATGSGTLAVKKDLAGTGDAAASGTGSLHVTRGLDSTAASAASGTGSMAVAVSLAGSGAAASAGSGTAHITRGLAGSGASASAGTGLLGIGVPLAGTGAAASHGSGTLAVKKDLAGSGPAASSGTGELSLTLGLSGSGASSSEGQATLHVTRGLSGTGDAASQGTGTLSMTVGLAGTGAAAADGTGTLTVGGVLDLDGKGPAASSGSGNLTVTYGLDGTGDAASSGTGDLSLTIGLSGAGPAASSGTGTLSTGVTNLDGSGPASSSGTGNLTVTFALEGTGDAASHGSGTLSVTRGLAGTGAASSDGTGDLALTVGLFGSGNAASSGTTDTIALTVGMAGTGAASSDGTGALLIRGAIWWTPDAVEHSPAAVGFTPVPPDSPTPW